MAVGNPAKVVGYTEKEDPSLSMKHGKIYMSCVSSLLLAACR